MFRKLVSRPIGIEITCPSFGSTICTIANNGQKASNPAEPVAQDLNVPVSKKKALEIIKQSIFLEYKQKTTDEKTMKPEEDEDAESNNNKVLENIFYG